MLAKSRGLMAWCVVVVLTAAVADVSAAGKDLRLVEAVKSGQRAAVRTLVQQKADLNAAESDGATALHWAAERDDLETAALLLGAGARPDVANDFGVTPLALACTNGSAALVDLLLRSGADPNASLPSGETPLMTAARTGNAAVVSSLLERGVAVNAQERSRGQTALMWAAAEGHANIVRLLLQHGADVKASSKAGFTALLLAARDADEETSRILLEAGADVNEAARDGTTALTVAVIRGHTAYANFLLDQGAYVDAGPGFTPLQWAVGDWNVELAGDNTFVRPEGSEWDVVLGLRGKEKYELVRLLLDYNADPNARAQSTPRYSGGRPARGKHAGANALLLEAQIGDAEMMRLLYEYGADPLVRSDNGVSCLMYAAGLYANFAIGYTSVKEEDALRAVKYCYELGDTDVNRVEKFGETALHGATYRGLAGSNGLIQFLVDKGARINVKNKRGWTPVTLAEGIYNNGSNTRNPDALALLMRLGGEPSPPNVERDAYSVIDEGGHGTIGSQVIPSVAAPEPATTTPTPR